jgi:protein-disulfide isomerase
MITNAKLRVPVTQEDHWQGPEDAPLTLVEYGDYECPFCGQAYPVIKRLQQALKDDLKFVFRNFPLTMAHPNAMNAALAAEAAALQGKFWEMHDTLYEHQDNLDPESLLEYAAALGLDLEKFRQDMKSPEVEGKVAKDLYGGARSGVNGTPNFFINGYKYEGDWSYPSLLTVLTAVRKQIGERRMKKAG